MPEFITTIPVEQMKQAPAKSNESAAQRAVKEFYEGMINLVPDGQAGIVQLTQAEIDTKDGRRGVKLRLRKASQRIGRYIVKMVDDGAEIQFEMGAVPAAKAEKKAKEAVLV